MMLHTAASPLRRPQEDDATTAENSTDLQQSIDSEPICLEGTLHVRKGKSSGHSSLLWKRRFVFLSLTDAGGSITVYKESSDHSSQEKEVIPTVLRTAFSKIQQRLGGNTNSKYLIDFVIPSNLPWIVKDVDNDHNTFVVEIPTSEDPQQRSEASVVTSNSSLMNAAAGFEDMMDDAENDNDEGNGGQFSAVQQQNGTTEIQDDLLGELTNARSKGRPLRVYFRCNKGSNEKALWLRAFARLDRLSKEIRWRKSLLGSLASPLHLGQNRERIRSESGVSFARDTRQLEQLDLIDESEGESIDIQYSGNDVEELVRGRSPRTSKFREHRVQPAYAYPHRWMTRNEMREEMLLPSETFHDLRVPGCDKKEVGSLRVEVLQCLGLPKLERASDTNAVAYLVCGSYAFATDVIPNRANPMWLRKAQRACEFPIFQAYARLYVGVFNDDQKRIKDEFAGRVVLNLARLRPRSTYDVTLPLRLSTQVYSRRRRGAIRLRFTLNWTSERDALMSYIPSNINIPLPQNSEPNTDVTVSCADPKSFRNVAITVHGAHPPGKFTFQQMRAAIREINFTRKYVFASIRKWIRETRHWQHPAMSAFIFLAWMHCIYANAFSLVPAYVVLFFVLQLMRNYAKRGIDGPGQRGFIPPSWEELFMALVRGGDPEYHAIEPLEMGLRPAPLMRRRSSESLAKSSLSVDPGQFDYTVTTHVPKGKSLFRSLGFLSDRDGEFVSVEEGHLEFPFANGTDYPKFSVKECMVKRKGDDDRESNDVLSVDDSDALQVASTGNGEIRMMPRFMLDMEMLEIMRKDSSGLNEFDEEEMNFAPRQAVVAEGRRAASIISKTATGLTDMTGLSHVVDPITSGINSGMHQVMDPITSGISSGVKRVNKTGNALRRSLSAESESSFLAMMASDELASDDNFDISSTCSITGIPSKELESEIDPAQLWPQQNVDIEGPSTGKKLTDDLAEIKDKMHEMTWHLFDDKLYVDGSSDACCFGEAKKPAEKRKTNTRKEVEKLMRVGPYSHSNPFIARVGMYVEPIIGSSYSFLSFFRAGFNVLTWRDPMLTFWLSLFSGLLAIILFVFPWRIFLFFLGFILVGPQNWVIRLLREQGRLPPLPKNGKRVTKQNDESHNDQEGLPKDKPLFKSNSLSDPDDVDPCEVHKVVVPYSPLIYQRFYDWPPEPQYAHVKPDVSTAESYPMPNQSADSKPVPTRRFGSRGGIRLRRRATRVRSFSSANNNGLPPINPRKRASTGDW